MRSGLARFFPFVLIPLVGVLLLAFPLACHRTTDELGEYYCPMHPDYHADKPGDCPICGMRLVKTEKKAAKAAPATEPPAALSGERQVLFYRNPMNPSVTSPVPMKDQMGMDYVPVYADEAKGAAGGIAGLAPVSTDRESLRLAGVQTAVAERQELTRTTRAPGLVVPDETRVRHIHTKVGGYIEKLYVNYTGQHVRAGQPLLSIYSPELLATQQELLRAREAAARFATSSLPEVRRGGEDLVTAARHRLELFDVPESFIDQLERTGQVRRIVNLTAPASGFVTGKEIFEGQEVQPGMDLLTLTDLSRVWIEADFYEYEARALRLGQKVVVALPYDPGVRLTGRVGFIFPTLDPQTRTLKVRLEFANPGLALKPGMYVDVTPDLETREGIVIPDSAIIDTGVRQVVFVETNGSFVPREVRVGSRSDGKALVLSGVAAGERVAVRANFLLDSESQLRAAVAGMNGSGAHRPEGGAQ
jgi:membrane fusion protein, copper/silver efflux system